MSDSTLRRRRNDGGEEAGLLASKDGRASSAATKPTGIVGWFSRMLAAASLAWTYTRMASKRDTRGWRIGVSTVALVVAFSAVLQAGIASSSVIFLRLAEEQAGETDIILSAEASPDGTNPAGSTGGFLNYTALAPALSSDPEFTGSAPRWLAPGRITPKANPAPSGPSTAAFVLALDSQLESAIGLGRAWSRRPLGEGECYVTSSALQELGVVGAQGQRVVLTVSMLELISGGQLSTPAGGLNTTGSDAAASAFLNASGLGGAIPATVPVDALSALALLTGQGGNASAIIQQNPALAALGLVTIDVAPFLRSALASAIAATTITADLTVVDSVASPQGKWPSLLGNVVVMEAQWAAMLLKQAAQQVVAQLQPIANALPGAGTGGAGGPSLADRIASLSATADSISYEWLQQRSMSVNVMWARRQDAYLNNMSHVYLSITEAGDAVLDSLGSAYPVTQSTPLADGLDGLSFIALFLQQVFNAVTTIMALLGAVVIYTLVLGDVDARTYELGMLRALGMGHATLAHLLVLQVVSFAGPGIVIGFIIAVAINIGLQVGIGSYASIALPLTLPGPAVGLALGLGLGVPCLAVVFPIQAALGSTLRDALDQSHTSINAVKIRLIRLAEAGLSPTQTAGAVLMSVIGFVTFYLLPLSFITGDLSWFLGVLTGVLMGMLLGLAAVAQALQPQLELLVLRLLLWLGAAGGMGYRYSRRAWIAMGRAREMLSRAMGFRRIRTGTAAAGQYSQTAAAAADGAVSRTGTQPQGQGRVHGPSASAIDSVSHDDDNGHIIEEADMDDEEEPGPGADGSWSADARLYTVVSKNLQGHRSRNRKSGYMVGMSSAFLVFASTMFGLQASNLTTNVKMLLGSDIVATVPEAFGAGVALPQERLDEYLAKEQGKPGTVLEGYTYISAPLTGVPFITRAIVANLIGLPPTRTRMYGVQSNFGRVAYSEYTQVASGLNSGVGDGAGQDTEDSSSQGASSSPTSGETGAALADPTAFDQAAGSIYGQASSTSGAAGISSTPSVSTDPVGALHAGAGSLRLPIEASLLSPPPPMVTGGEYWPMFACAVDLAVAAGEAGAGESIDTIITAARSRAASITTTSVLPSYATPPYRAVSVVDAARRFNTTAQAYASYAKNGGYTAVGWNSYDACLLVCNSDRIIAANATAGPNGRSGSACGTGAFDYEGPGTFAWAQATAQQQQQGGNGAVGPYDPATGPLVSESGSCGLPMPCLTVSNVDAAAQARGIVSSYTRYVDVIVSEALLPAASVEVTSPLQARLLVRPVGGTTAALNVYMAKARAMVRKLPGFLFSSYAALASRSPVLVTMKDAHRLLTESTRLAQQMSGTVQDGTSDASAAVRDRWPALPTWLPVVPQAGSGPSSGPYQAVTVNVTRTVPVLPAGMGQPRADACGSMTTTGSSSQPVVSCGPGPALPFDGNTSTLLLAPAGGASRTDVDTSSVLLAKRLNVTGSVTVGWSLASCAFLSGVTLSMPPLSPVWSGGGATSASSLSLPWQVFGLSGPEGRGWKRVARGVFTYISTGSSSSPQPFTPSSPFVQEAGFPAYSGQHWALVVGPWTAHGTDGATGRTVTSTTTASSLPVPVPDVSSLRIHSLGDDLTAPCAAADLDSSEGYPAVPKHRLLVKVRDGADSDARARLLNGIRSAIGSNLISVQDTAGLLASTGMATIGLQIFFDFVAALCLLLCFFATWLSFSANVRETSTEFAVLRSLGLSAGTATRAYVYEALTVVLTALGCGIVIGVAIAVALTLQFGLFTEMPFRMEFPTPLVLLFTAACCVLSAVASVSPARALARLPIASVLKGRTE